MAGFFTVSASVSGSTVFVTVNGHDLYKGTVDLAYSSPSTPPPLYIAPTSDSVYVPMGGSVNASFEVGVVAGQSVDVDITGSDGTQIDTTSATGTG